jgi:hypothetical protein
MTKIFVIFIHGRPDTAIRNALVRLKPHTLRMAGQQTMRQ